MTDDAIANDPHEIINCFAPEFEMLVLLALMLAWPPWQAVEKLLRELFGLRALHASAPRPNSSRPSHF